MRKLKYLFFILSIVFLYRYNISLIRTVSRKISLTIWPYEEKVLLCSSLTNKIKSDIPKNINMSIAVLDDRGNKIIDIDSNRLKIPASNQKLISTAYAIDKLYPTYTLKTMVFVNAEGFYQIVGSGDPDLSNSDIKKLAQTISNHYTSNKSLNLNIYLYEEPNYFWWNRTWSYSDRQESYGAPITRLALTSNANERSYIQPLEKFKSTLSNYLSDYGHQPIFFEKRHSDFTKTSLARPLITIESEPLYSLLSLSNSESHNFTSEVILRVSSDTWDYNYASLSLQKWLTTLRLPNGKYQIKDASGLSRSNKVTADLLANLLYVMKNHRYSEYYISSMSLLGYRGTLKHDDYSKNFSGVFLGKTGTLKGIRSLSGYLLTDKGYRYVSIISDSHPEIRFIHSNILNSILNSNMCN